MLDAIARALADWRYCKRSRDNCSTNATEAALKEAQAKLQNAVRADCEVIPGGLPPRTAAERIAHNRAKRSKK